MRILVVDDHAEVAYLQVLLLKKKGFDAHTYAQGDQVLEMLECLRPDVLLLDLSMPGMNGFDVAEQLRQRSELRPALLIAVTGYNDEETRERTHAAGFDHHLVKPVDWSTLQEVLNSLPVS